MSEHNTGWRSILRLPAIYTYVQMLLGAKRVFSTFVHTYLQPNNKDRLLDVGCGPARIIEFLPDIEYFGIDISIDYLQEARERFGDRGRFAAISATEIANHKLPFQPSLVSAIGLLHHLSDEQAEAFVSGAFEILQEQGRLVTIDPVFVDKQNIISRTLIKLDRGTMVRSEQKYEELISKHFQKVKVFVRKDLLNVPYSHCIVIAEK